MKQSAILVMLTEPMEALPASEREAVSRFLFRRVRGLSPEHQRRWARFWKRLINGECAKFYPVVDRSLVFHQRHMAIENRLFEEQDGFSATTAGRRWFRNWLKVGAALVHLELKGEAAEWVAGSLSYEDLSDDEMREFHEAAMDFLKQPHALKRLWPHVKPELRAQMLEAALVQPEPSQPAAESRSTQETP